MNKPVKASILAVSAAQVAFAARVGPGTHDDVRDDLVVVQVRDESHVPSLDATGRFVLIQTPEHVTKTVVPAGAVSDPPLPPGYPSPPPFAHGEDGGLR